MGTRPRLNVGVWSNLGRADASRLTVEPSFVEEEEVALSGDQIDSRSRHEERRRARENVNGSNRPRADEPEEGEERERHRPRRQHRQ